jgi:hypothetical protein
MILAGALLCGAARPASASNGDAPDLKVNFRGWEAKSGEEAVDWFRTKLTGLESWGAWLGTWDGQELKFFSKIQNPCRREQARQWFDNEHRRREVFVNSGKYRLNTEFNRRISSLRRLKSNWLGNPSYDPAADLAAEAEKKRGFDAQFNRGISEENRKQREYISLGVLSIEHEVFESDKWVVTGSLSASTPDLDRFNSDLEALVEGYDAAKFNIDYYGNLFWDGRAVTVVVKDPKGGLAPAKALEQWHAHYVQIVARSRLLKVLDGEPLPPGLDKAKCLLDGKTDWSKRGAN